MGEIAENSVSKLNKEKIWSQTFNGYWMGRLLAPTAIHSVCIQWGPLLPHMLKQLVK